MTDQEIVFTLVNATENFTKPRFNNKKKSEAYSVFIAFCRHHYQIYGDLNYEYLKKQLKKKSIFFDPTPYYLIAYNQFCDIINSVRQRFVVGYTGEPYAEKLYKKFSEKNKKYLK